MEMLSSMQQILANYEGRGREALLPILWEVQRADGHIGKDAVREISHFLRIPEADIYGVIGFYSLFYAEAQGRQIIRVCTDPVCGLAGADALLHELEADCTKDSTEYSLEHSPCLGMCDHAPAVLISERGKGERCIAKASSQAVLASKNQADYENKFASAGQVLLGTSQRESLADYGDYAALSKALQESPEAIIEEVVASGLIGRGGAAFPTGLKWRYTRQSGKTPYLVCNADESEPGTFKDRVLMESCPHLLLEGIALAAYAISAEKAYLFIRGEYPLAESILQDAYAEALAVGYFGNSVLGTEYRLTLEIRRGAGAYICGEETALFEAIEGKRGFPRIKPPYPTTHGLFGAPTVVNNVETLCTIPYIVSAGASSFKAHGTEKSTGTKLVSVSGHVKKAGAYEIVPSLPLRNLLEKQCDGIVGDLQAVLMGGASGTFLSPEEIDVALTQPSQATTSGSGKDRVQPY